MCGLRPVEGGHSTRGLRLHRAYFSTLKPYGCALLQPLRILNTKKTLPFTVDGQGFLLLVLNQALLLWNGCHMQQVGATASAKRYTSNHDDGVAGLGEIMLCCHIRGVIDHFT